MSFRNRSEAGRKLAARLKRYKDQQPVILRFAAWWRSRCIGSRGRTQRTS